MNRRLKEKYGVDYIYHFTDTKNVDKIQEIGLYPRNMLDDDSYTPGGNEWSIDADNMFGLDSYVHCCFLPNHPMEYLARKEGRIIPIWLKINAEILSKPKIRYTPGVSNRSDMNFYDNEEAKKNLDLLPLYEYLDWKIPENGERRRDAEKYEILLPFIIPPNYIEVY